MIWIWKVFGPVMSVEEEQLAIIIHCIRIKHLSRSSQVFFSPWRYQGRTFSSNDGLKEGAIRGLGQAVHHAGSVWEAHFLRIVW